MPPNPPPPTAGPAAGLPARAFTPVRNPVYVYNDDDSWKPKAAGTRHVLDQQPSTPKDVDPRLTAAGSRPPVTGLTQIVPTAYQTPTNVWEYPQ